MTAGPRYRFRAAETLKRAEGAAAKRKLASAQRALAAALEDAAEAQRALAEHIARTPHAVALEGAGMMRALELQRAADFALRHEDTARALRAELQRLQMLVAARQAAVLAEQAALGTAHAGEQVLERDRERFEHAQRKRAEHDEQVEIEEDLGNRGGRNPV